MRYAPPYARVKTEVALALFSVEELGLEAHASSLSGVYERARQIGLEVCPAEVGPRLRRQTSIWRIAGLGDS
jgi:hypothetical protein